MDIEGQWLVWSAGRKILFPVVPCLFLSLSFSRNRLPPQPDKPTLFPGTRIPRIPFFIPFSSDGQLVRASAASGRVSMDERRERRRAEEATAIAKSFDRVCLCHSYIGRSR